MHEHRLRPDSRAVAAIQPSRADPPPYGRRYGAAAPSVDRIRIAWQQRAESDYIFDFWTALGWTILTLRFLRLLRHRTNSCAARAITTSAASRCSTPRPRSRGSRREAQGVADELQPNFDRIAAELDVLRQQAARVPRPGRLDAALRSSRGIVHIIVFILLDGDLVDHDRAEGAIEHELSAIYARLGAPVPAPDPARLKEKHNYVGRIVATLAHVRHLRALVAVRRDDRGATVHFEHNWRWEDALARRCSSCVG